MGSPRMIALVVSSVADDYKGYAIKNLSRRSL